MENAKNLKANGTLEGFSPVSAPRIFWNSRRRSASGRNLDKVTDEPDAANPTSNKQGEFQVTTEKNHLHDSTMVTEENNHDSTIITEENLQDSTMVNKVSERRRAMFEPLEPIHNINGKRPSAESLLPPPDFDSMPYPKGWLIGKKRKLVNVDVVESMRRIAIQEMNRKDREIDALNEQLEEDARCMEHLQIQLLQERSKRSEIERGNTMLQDQVSLLMNMLGQNEEEESGDEP